MVDWTHITATSKEIIIGLAENGIKLKAEDKQLIIDKVYELVTSDHNSNGCDCGQMSCAICHG